MNIKDVRALTELMVKNQLTRLEFSEGDYSVKLERTPPAVYAPMAESITARLAETVHTAAAMPAVDAAPAVADANLHEIKSPVMGVFYSAPSPDAPPFVSVGQKVARGDVLCIIEVMKQMNEITAEEDGVVAEVCLRKGEIAEFGQTLFKMRK